MIELAEVDPQANATEPRGSGNTPQPTAGKDGDELPATAAGIAYANDLRPLVDPEGGYRDPHDDPDNQRICPALLLLDPLVRLHSLDENSASDISSLLGFLRAINRRHQLALVLVHHMAKRSRRSLGQSLRGSSDLHAWTDSACYLVRRPDDRLQLTVEHRSAPAPDPLLLRLSGGGDQPLSLLVDSAAAPPPPLPEAVRAALRSAGQPLSRTVLRQRLRVNNARLGVALLSLQQRGQPSAAPTAGTCRPDTHPRLPTRSHPATVPLFRRSAPGTRSERNDHRPHSASSILQPTSTRGAQRNTTTAACRRATGQSCGSRSTVAPAISAFGPLHGRQTPPLGRQRTARRQSRPLSGPGHPSKIRKVPVNAVLSAPLAPPGPHACTVPRTTNSTPALGRRRATLERITASLTQIRAPSMAVTSSKKPPCTGCHRIGPLPRWLFYRNQRCASLVVALPHQLLHQGTE